MRSEVVSASAPISSPSSVAPGNSARSVPGVSPELQQAFQDFVAGTFFQQMLKTLRKTQGQPAYFHGGQAEEVFRSQLDQHVAEDLARTHGAALSEPLFDTFARRLGA